MDRRLDTYLERFEPMQRGKVRNALERQGRFNGRYLFRHQYAEELATKPFLKLDAAKGRLFTSEEGTFFDVKALTQTLVDYALYLRAAPVLNDK